MKPVILHCEANVELTAIAKHYACDRLELARAFLTSFRATRDAIEKQPSRFSFLEKPVRRAHIAGFPYRTFMKNLTIAFRFWLSCTTAVSPDTGKAD